MMLEVIEAQREISDDVMRAVEQDLDLEERRLSEQRDQAG